MKILDFLDEIFSEGYEDVDDYCNQNGLNYDDVFDYEENIEEDKRDGCYYDDDD